MAKMIPSVVSPEIKSNAEKKYLNGSGMILIQKDG